MWMFGLRLSMLHLEHELLYLDADTCCEANFSSIPQQPQPASQYRILLYPYMQSSRYLSR
jgi:hypothetical protein